MAPPPREELERGLEERRLDLLVEAAELEKRRAALPAAPKVERRGYDRLYNDHVLQADEGVDFDFLGKAKS